MNMKKYALGAMSLTAVMALAIALPAFAASNGSGKANTPANTNRPAGVGGPNRQNNLGLGQDMTKPFVVGTVSAISGNTITVVGRAGASKATATTTFTVNATNAKVTKGNGNATSTVSSIVVGDVVAVQGTITGTNVVATSIRDGVMGGPGIGFGFGKDKKGVGTSTNSFAGNGEPVIAGTISSISGSTISITNRSNVVYTVDATNAKILQGQGTTTLSTLKTGDAVVVQGTINGTAVVASSIIDQAKPANTGNGNNKNAHPGFFGGIGQFFMHLFGF